MRLFDLHCDTLTECCRRGYSLYSNPCHVDVSRGCSFYEQWIQVMAVFVPDHLNEDEAWRYTLRNLAFLKEQQELCDQLKIVTDIDGLTGADTPPCCRVLPAVENGRSIGEKLDRIAILSALGVAYVTVTWNGSNAWGNGCLSSDQSGLTPLGKAAIDKLFAEHVMPDVSHLNQAGFWDVVQTANGRPFLASHSLSKTIRNHPRNLTDEQFCAVVENGGIVGINLCEAHLGEQSFVCARRHLEHFLFLGGESAIALGLDLDGTDMKPSWQGIACALQFYEYLLGCGYDQALLDNIFYRNSYAFFVKTLTSKAECIRIGT